MMVLKGSKIYEGKKKSESKNRLSRSHTDTDTCRRYCVCLNCFSDGIKKRDSDIVG